MSSKWKTYLGGHTFVQTDGLKFTGWGKQKKKVKGGGLLAMAPAVADDALPELIKRSDLDNKFLKKSRRVNKKRNLAIKSK